MSRKIIGRSAIDKRYRLDPRYFRPLLPDGIRYDPADDVYALVAIKQINKAEKEICHE